MNDFITKIGYRSNGGKTERNIREYCERNNIEIKFKEKRRETPRRLSSEDIFCENSSVNQSTIRKHFRRLDNIEYKCSVCDLPPFWNGEELTLILDHINGVNNDNRLSNLRWVCPNCNQQLPTTGGKNKKPKPILVYRCQDCGKIISKGMKRCIECDRKYRHESIRHIPITRTELKQKIRTMPFMKIAEEFQKTDNTIRKWCKKFNLPFRVTDIKQISDEEWELI